LKCLESISIETIGEFLSAATEYSLSTSPEKTNIIAQDKYKNIAQLSDLLHDHNHHWVDGFKSAYSVYKQYLTLIAHTMEVSDPTLAKISKDSLICSIVLSSIPSKPLDHHLFLQLLRVHILGPKEDEKYRHPLFSAEQAYQIAVYLDEIYDILRILAFISEKYKTPHNVFMTLPISITINKKISDFFGKPISKTTYSILLDYLQNTNTSLTTAVVEHLKGIPK
jgi:hypothetical protein